LSHGALVDASGWRAVVYAFLSKDGFHVTIVQERSPASRRIVRAAKRSIDQQTGPVVLVGHSYAGSVITDAGADPKVSALVYVCRTPTRCGGGSGKLLSKFGPAKRRHARS